MPSHTSPAVSFDFDTRAENYIQRNYDLLLMRNRELSFMAR